MIHKSNTEITDFGSPKFNTKSRKSVNRGSLDKGVPLYYGLNQLFYSNSCLFHFFICPILWLLMYWDILFCSADVHVLLHSTNGYSLPHPTPLWYQLLGNIHKNSSILLWLHVARNKVCTNWLIDSSVHSRGMRNMPLKIIFSSFKTCKAVTHINQVWIIIWMKNGSAYKYQDDSRNSLHSKNCLKVLIMTIIVTYIPTQLFT
jgi:hypothetical protein